MKKAGLAVVCVHCDIVCHPIAIVLYPRQKWKKERKCMTTNCVGCHMENGMGVPRMNPALVNSPYVMGHPD